MAKEVNLAGKQKATYTNQEVQGIVAQYQEQIGRYEQYVGAMQNQIKELELDGIIKRVDILFNVLKFADYFDAAFVQECADELVTIIKLPEAPVKPEPKEEVSSEKEPELDFPDVEKNTPEEE